MGAEPQGLEASAVSLYCWQLSSSNGYPLFQAQSRPLIDADLCAGETQLQRSLSCQSQYVYEIRPYSAHSASYSLNGSRRVTDLVKDSKFDRVACWFLADEGVCCGYCFNVPVASFDFHVGNACRESRPPSAIPIISLSVRAVHKRDCGFFI